MDNRIYATYTLATGLPAAMVAETVAGEQSSGTFVKLANESSELKERSGARVEALDDLGPSTAPPLPGSYGAGSGTRDYRLVLSWPYRNIGPSLPNLVATVAGNLFELREVAGLKIEDITLPTGFADAHPGPAFGVEGTRSKIGVHDRPIIGTIIKPSIGLTAEETAQLVDELCEGGIDFIKDDELQSDGPDCPFEDRLRAVLRVIEKRADISGRRVMYAVNITGDLDQMRRRHDLVEKLGGNCVMISLNSVGLVGTLALRAHCRLPIHAHRNGWGYLGRSAANGWSYVAWQKLWRLAGVDHMHVNGLRNKFWEPDDSVITSARECLKPLFPDKPCIVMPVFSSGQTVVQASGTWKALKSRDLIYCAGGGIMAHPGGIAAGVRALRDAWQAAVDGIPIEEAASSSPELSAAYKKFA